MKKTAQHLIAEVPRWQTSRVEQTIGIDLGDVWSHYCTLNEDGEVVDRGRFRTTPKAIAKWFTDVPHARVVMEAGTHSIWISEELQALEHEVIVANVRELRAISHSDRKSDQVDAEKLARYARLDPEILRPIAHRSVEQQEALTLIRARELLVRLRTAAVNAGTKPAKTTSDYALEELGRAIDRVLDEVKQSQPDPLKRIAQGAESLFLFFTQNPERARILLVESSGLSPRLVKTRRSITRRQVEELRQMFESAPALFSVEDASIAARCVAGATFEAIYSWLEGDPNNRMQAAEFARAVARFNTQAVRKEPAQRESNSVMRSGSPKAR
jgi:hypothetical protein